MNPFSSLIIVDVLHDVLAKLFSPVRLSNQVGQLVAHQLLPYLVLPDVVDAQDPQGLTVVGLDPQN